MTTVDDILVEARSWIGTPYQHCADIKGVGVDCCMLLVRVYSDTGAAPCHDPRPYSADWYLHRSEEMYLTGVTHHASRSHQPMRGGVVLVRMGRCYAHGGIVTVPSPLTIVHAYQPYRVVVEEELGWSHPVCHRDREMIFTMPPLGVV